MTDHGRAPTNQGGVAALMPVRSRGRAFALSRAAATVVLLLAATAASTVSALSWSFAPVSADETLVVWTAKQVSNGRVPYRDFFDLTPPVGLYALGAYARAAGAGLASFRRLTLVWMAGSTLLLFQLLRASNAPRWAASAAALLLPGLFFPFWPATSHHWFALGLGLAALALVTVADPSPVRWFAAGVLAAAAGLIIQTEGAWFLALVVFRLLLLFPARRRRAAGVALTAGAVLPVVASAAALYAAEALGDGIGATIIWPARYYRQPGGENDVAAGAPRALPAGNIDADVLGVASFIAAAALPVVLIVMLATSPYLLRRQREQRPDWLLAVAATLLAFVLFLRGRTDWTHFVFWLTPLLLLLVRETNWTSRDVRTRVVRGWLVLAVLVVGLRWTAHWWHSPPTAAGVTMVDNAFRASSLPTLVDELQGARDNGDPILYLDARASGLYLYWAPVPPPVSWVSAPSSPFNSPDHYSMLADFANEQHVPWIVVPNESVASFLRDDTPIRDLLRTRYEELGQTSWGVAFHRIGHRTQRAAQSAEGPQ